MTNSTQASDLVITRDNLLEHWQGHRRLTRKVIETFPEDKFFTYSIGGMRPFSELVQEMLGMTVPGIKGIVSRKWEKFEDASPAKTKEEVLKRWDDATEQLDKLWKDIPEGRFQENDSAFGQWEGSVHYFIFYFIDNEIHHRGQAYVYLRSLGIEPPGFYQRSF